MTVPSNAALVGRGVLAAPKPLVPITPATVVHDPSAYAIGGITGDLAARVASTAAPPAPPVAPDFNALTNADPQYITGNQDLQNQNQLTLAQMLKGYLGGAQAAQDNANAHGALFSGAAVHAQNYAAQNYADQAAQQAQNLASGEHTLYTGVYNRLVAQLSGVPTT